MHMAHYILDVTPSIESYEAADEKAPDATPAPPTIPIAANLDSDQLKAGARLHPLPNISTSIVTEGYAAQARDHRDIGRCSGALNGCATACLPGLSTLSAPPGQLRRELGAFTQGEALSREPARRRHGFQRPSTGNGTTCVPKGIMETFYCSSPHFKPVCCLKR